MNVVDTTKIEHGNWNKMIKKGFPKIIFMNGVVLFGFNVKFRCQCGSTISWKTPYQLQFSMRICKVNTRVSSPLTRCPIIFSMSFHVYGFCLHVHFVVAEKCHIFHSSNPKIPWWPHLSTSIRNPCISKRHVRTIFPIFPINPLVKSAKFTPCFRLGDLEKSGLQELLRVCEDRVFGEIGWSARKKYRSANCGARDALAKFYRCQLGPKMIQMLRT